MAKHIRRELRNAEAAKVFGRFVASSEGKHWLSITSAPSAPVIVAPAEDTLRHLLDRLEDELHKPPVRIAIVDGDTVEMVLLNILETEADGSEIVDPGTTLAMLLALVRIEGGSINFRASAWSAPAEVRQLQPA